MMKKLKAPNPMNSGGSPNKALQLTRFVQRVLTSSFRDMHNWLQHFSITGASN